MDSSPARRQWSHSTIARTRENRTPHILRTAKRKQFSSAVWLLSHWQQHQRIQVTFFELITLGPFQTLLIYDTTAGRLTIVSNFFVLKLVKPPWEQFSSAVWLLSHWQQHQLIHVTFFEPIALGPFQTLLIYDATAGRLTIVSNFFVLKLVKPLWKSVSVAPQMPGQRGCSSWSRRRCFPRHPACKPSSQTKPSLSTWTPASTERHRLALIRTARLRWASEAKRFKMSTASDLTLVNFFFQFALTDTAIVSWRR